MPQGGSSVAYKAEAGGRPFARPASTLWRTAFPLLPIGLTDTFSLKDRCKR
jgi:hypothetical protein